MSEKKTKKKNIKKKKEKWELSGDARSPCHKATEAAAPAAADSQATPCAQDRT
jgi:hypothetical protein